MYPSWLNFFHSSSASLTQNILKEILYYPVSFAIEKNERNFSISPCFLLHWKLSSSQYPTRSSTSLWAVIPFHFPGVLERVLSLGWVPPQDNHSAVPQVGLLPSPAPLAFSSCGQFQHLCISFAFNMIKTCSWIIQHQAILI